jgi:hypothetical protein
LNFLKNAAVLEGKPKLAHIAKHGALAVVDLSGGLNRHNVPVSDPIRPNFHVSGIPKTWK